MRQRAVINVEMFFDFPCQPYCGQISSDMSASSLVWIGTHPKRSREEIESVGDVAVAPAPAAAAAAAPAAIAPIF